MCIEWMQCKGEQVSTSSPKILQVNPPSVAPTSCRVPRGGRLGADPALTCPLLPYPSPPTHGQLPARCSGDPSHTHSCTRPRLVSAALEGRTESVGKALEGEDLNGQGARGKMCGPEEQTGGEVSRWGRGHRNQRRGDSEKHQVGMGLERD